MVGEASGGGVCPLTFVLLTIIILTSELWIRSICSWSNRWA